MTGMEYPFLGRFKNIEETHGHGAAKRSIPTSLSLRLSGENLVLEEISSSNAAVEVSLSQKGSHVTAPLPTRSSVPIPNDGKTYFVSSKVENKEARHFCKLTLEGRKSLNPYIPDHPKTVVVQSRYGYTPDGHVGVSCGIHESSLPIGDSTTLDIAAADTLTITMPRPTSTPQPPPTPVARQTPKLDIGFSLSQGKTAVNVIALGGNYWVEIVSGHVQDKRVGQCHVDLEATRSHQVDIHVYATDGSTKVLSQSINIPALEKGQTSGVDIRIDDQGVAKNIVATGPGATISTSHDGTFNGIPGIRLPNNSSHALAIRQSDGSSANLQLTSSGEYWKWAEDLANAIQKTPSDAAAMVRAIRSANAPLSSPGDTIGKFICSLLEALPCKVSLKPCGEQLENLSCAGGALTAVIGSQPPCLIPNNSNIKVGSSKSITLKTQHNGLPELAHVALDTTGLPSTPFLDALANALRPGRGDLATVKSGVRALETPDPTSEHIKGSLIDVLSTLDNKDFHAVSLACAANQSANSIFAKFDDQHSPQALSSEPMTIPASTKSVTISSVESRQPMPDDTKSILPDILSVYRSHSEPSGWKHGWSALHAPKTDENALLNVLLALCERLLQQPTPSAAKRCDFQYTATEGRVHSIQCPPYRVLASVDDLPPVAISVTECIPATGTFSPGTTHKVTLSAVDDKNAVVGTTSLSIPVPRETNVNGPGKLDFEIDRFDTKTRLTIRAPEAYQVDCEVAGRRVTLGKSTCVVDLDAQFSHDCLVIVTRGGEVTMNQMVKVPRMALPPFRTRVEGHHIQMEEAPGVIFSMSDNGSREAICQRHELLPDIPHSLIIRQFLAASTHSHIGEQRMVLPPFADAQGIRDLVTILSEADEGPWSRLIHRLMRLHGRTKSELLKELITLLVTKFLEQDAAHKMDLHRQAVSDMIKTIRVSSGHSGHNNVLFFRLKGDEGTA